MTLQIVGHPLAQHLVMQLRDQRTPPAQFRTLTRHLATILALEATGDLPTRPLTVQTPLEPCEGQILVGSIVVVPILRAGLGMVDAIVEMFPEVAIGYIGLERDHTTAIASTYYCKLPPLVGQTVLLVDPMLATGGSACQAIDALEAEGATDIRLVCVVAAPEGVQRVREEHPNVHIWAAVQDRCLNDQRYILPGLGDFGDRLYGTDG